MSSKLTCDLSQLQYKQCIKLISEYLEKAQSSSTVESTQRCQPHRILCPPVDCCINDGGTLIANHKPTIVTVYTLTGPEVAEKYSLKCMSCQCIYNYSMFGNKFKEGERYYNEPRELIDISDTVFCERSLYEFFCSLR